MNTETEKTNVEKEVCSVEVFESNFLEYLKKGETKEGLRYALKTVVEYPDDIALHICIARLLGSHLSLHEISAMIFQDVLKRDPNNIQIEVELAGALIAEGDVVSGCAKFADMMTRYPQYRTELCEHMSQVLLDEGYFQEALDILLQWDQQAISSLWLMNNIGTALCCLNRPQEAILWYDKYLERDRNHTDVLLARGIALMKAGRFKEGFPDYIGRELSLSKQEAELWFLSLPRLGRDDISGKRVVLYQEQGFGDSINFIRFVPSLLERGADVTLIVPKPLRRLFALSYPKCHVFDVRDEFVPSAEEKYDYSAPIPDLPFIAGVEKYEDIPSEVPYLRVDEHDRARYAALLPEGRPKIGLVWAGERRLQYDGSKTDKRRSTNLHDMCEALTPIDAVLVSLQLGNPREELSAWGGQKIVDLMGMVKDMADTAALMENLDLIISVDTSPLHLAGALGRPVWLVNRYDSCWRWGCEGETSAWYPTLRIFRRHDPRSFKPVLQEIGKALQQWRLTWKPDMGIK